MQADEWERIKRIFDSAVKLSPSDRGSYLAGACSNNRPLLETVRELLQAHDEASSFLAEEPEQQELPPVFEAGQLVAERFRIVRLISRGGMGEVYESYDEVLAVRLALKTMRPEYAGNIDALERFRREIRVTREIGHPNLCRVHDLVEHHLPAESPDSPARIITCLTMQLMSGENLQQYLAKSGRLSPETAFPLIKQIAGAIGVLHENSVVHRDLKPSNVMITPSASGELRAIVMDFGLAKPFNSEGEIFKSRSTFNAGAPFFLAPELVRGERPSIASDIYAFGLIIDEMVTGGGAFSGDTVESILYQKLWGDPQDPLTRAPSLPSAWCRAIRLCLQRNPAKRPSSAAEVIRELTEAPSETQTETQRVPPFYLALRKLGGFVPTVHRLRPSRLRILLVACAVLILGVCTYLGVLGRLPLNTSVVVFPFENLTGNPENDYLSKFLTNEVERRLLQIEGVTVYPFRDVRPKDAQIKLNARFSMDGKLWTNKGGMGLEVQLIDIPTHRLICCGNVFESNTGDPLEMQSTIASSAADAMRDAILLPPKEADGGLPEAFSNLLHLVPLPGKQTEPTTSSAAMHFFVRGDEFWQQRTPESELQARDLFEKAIAEDKNYALAYAELAGVESSLAQYNLLTREQLFRSAHEHALQAVAKGPNYPESYLALATTDQNSWNWQAAEQDYKHALLLNSKLALAHRWYGGFLIQFGKFDQGLAETYKSIDLEPYDTEGRLNLGTYLCFAGKPADAITFVKGYLAEKDYPVGHTILAYAYAQLAMNEPAIEKTAMLDDAKNEADILAQRDQNSSGPDYTHESVPLYALVYALGGEKQKARKYIEILRRGERAGVVDPVDLAHPYIALGEWKSGFEILNRAAAAKDGGLLYLKVDPFLQPLRRTAEYQKLIRKIGL